MHTDSALHSMFGASPRMIARIDLLGCFVCWLVSSQPCLRYPVWRDRIPMPSAGGHFKVRGSHPECVGGS